MGLSPPPVSNVCMYEGLALSADRPDHLKLFRRHVSRHAYGKGRAVLEGVGLISRTIEECFHSNPLDEERAVQEGLIRWCGGQGTQPPTWNVLIMAMEYARIAQQHIQNLKESLGLFGMLFVIGMPCCVCVRLFVCYVYGVMCSVLCVVCLLYSACHLSDGCMCILCKMAIGRESPFSVDTIVSNNKCINQVLAPSGGKFHSVL